MPYFKVMIEGEGVIIPSENNEPSITGFFTSRLVRAVAAAEAENEAKNMIMLEWSSGLYAKANKGALPILTVTSIDASSFMESLTFKNEGYSFYRDEEQPDRSA